MGPRGGFGESGWPTVGQNSENMHFRPGTQVFTPRKFGFLTVLGAIGPQPDGPKKVENEQKQLFLRLFRVSEARVNG